MTGDAGLAAALAACLERRLTFVAFRLPGEAVVLWVQRQAALERIEPSLLHEANDVFLIAPFGSTDENLAIIRPDIGYLFSDPTTDLDLLGECTGAFTDPPILQAITEKDDFEQGVRDALAAIASPVLEKVVLSRIINGAIGIEALPACFELAMDRYPDAMVVLLNTPDHGTWIGASPERLITASEDAVRVDALAGTMGSAAAPPRPEAWADKERTEQYLVTRGILNAFLELGLGGVQVRGPEVATAGPVAHLRTTVHGELADRPLADLVLALHPTPAVCGVPSRAAIDFIARHEAHARRLYAGFWGPWAPDGRTDLYVNIRCMEVSKTDASLYVGAGIVAGSEARREWEETAQKARTWLDLVPAGSGS